LTAEDPYELDLVGTQLRSAIREHLDRVRADAYELALCSKIFDFPAVEPEINPREIASKEYN
jgi:hypothetical protein